MSEQRAAVENNNVNKVLERIFNHLKKGHLSHELQHLSSIPQQLRTDVLISNHCFECITLGAFNTFEDFSLVWQITVAFISFCGGRDQT